jgi:hypothetical protein
VPNLLPGYSNFTSLVFPNIFTTIIFLFKICWLQIFKKCVTIFCVKRLWNLVTSIWNWSYLCRLQISGSQKYSNKISDHIRWNFKNIFYNYFWPNLIVLPILNLIKIQHDFWPFWPQYVSKWSWIKFTSVDHRFKQKILYFCTGVNEFNPNLRVSDDLTDNEFFIWRWPKYAWFHNQSGAGVRVCLCGVWRFSTNRVIYLRIRSKFSKNLVKQPNEPNPLSSCLLQISLEEPLSNIFLIIALICS